MHGGAGGKDYWIGDDALMQFEFILDMFDVRFIMPWATDVLDLNATSDDIARVTGEIRAKFLYGLAVQGDRSQGHLTMAEDCTNANKIRKRRASFLVYSPCLMTIRVD